MLSGLGLNIVRCTCRLACATSPALQSQRSRFAAQKCPPEGNRLGRAERLYWHRQSEKEKVGETIHLRIQIHRRVCRQRDRTEVAELLEGALDDGERAAGRVRHGLHQNRLAYAQLDTLVGGGQLAGGQREMKPERRAAGRQETILCEMPERWI